MMTGRFLISFNLLVILHLTHLPLLIRPPSTLWNVTNVRKGRERKKMERKKDKARY